MASFVTCAANHCRRWLPLTADGPTRRSGNVSNISDLPNVASAVDSEIVVLQGLVSLIWKLSIMGCIGRVAYVVLWGAD
jgi:hypothetical protein